MKRLAVLISGFGSNLQSLIDWEKQGKLLGHVTLVISDNLNAYGLKRAELVGIKTKTINYDEFNSSEEAENEINIALEENKIDLVISAGFMKILTYKFVTKWHLKLINLHPSLLPAFTVNNAIEEAFNFGVKVTGVSTRFVEEGIDTGIIILQERVEIENDETIDSLTRKIHELEHKILPQTVNIVVSNKFTINGRKLLINSE